MIKYKKRISRKVQSHNRRNFRGGNLRKWCLWNGELLKAFAIIAVLLVFGNIESNKLKVGDCKNNVCPTDWDLSHLLL